MQRVKTVIDLELKPDRENESFSKLYALKDLEKAIRKAKKGGTDHFYLTVDVSFRGEAVEGMTITFCDSTKYE